MLGVPARAEGMRRRRRKEGRDAGGVILVIIGSFGRCAVRAKEEESIVRYTVEFFSRDSTEMKVFAVIERDDRFTQGTRLNKETEEAKRRKYPLFYSLYYPLSQATENKDLRKNGAYTC